MDKKVFESLISYLEKVPSVDSHIAYGIHEDGLWWIKFKIDIENELAWSVVQELGSVVNYLSINERLPTTFHPVSPAPYINGGPSDFLSWVIEATNRDFMPDTLLEWLKERLPNPVDDLEEWNLNV